MLDLLTVPDVARELKVSRGLAYRLVREGEIPALRISEANIRVRRADLDRYVARLARGSGVGVLE
jgi:excisionase family DNA binding protein